ncbi:MAG: HAMP domain-containing sensor histidine kinase, partial [Cyanobacteriota bacterium]|nr:HAMP domain-containing sensor histidine kinase [Cyanobacteriota bacterium]
CGAVLSLPTRGGSSSIRTNLQTTSLLAVLAGYLLLLTANRQLAHQQLLHRHSRAVAAAGEQFAPFSNPGGGRRALQQSLSAFSSPGRLIWLQPQGSGGPPILPAGAAFDGFLKPAGLLAVADQKAASSPAPVIFEHQGRTYLTSSLRLFVQGDLQRMRFLDDISDEAEQERLIFLLLVALAGLAALFTSMLLRLVIHRALSPLERFSATLKRVSSRTLSDERLPAEQPSELQPMAASFNDMLERMASSWEHQRTFVNAVSHELRTPITLILGYIGRLQRRAANLEPRQQEQLAQVHAEASRMGRLVSDLLEIAREDAGRLEVRQEPTDAWEALEAVHERLQAQLGSRLQLAARPAAADLEVLGDGERLEQCLTNLIENAVKYAPPGTPIELSAALRGEQVLLHVRDQGPGVPPADRRRIFRRFERGSQTGDQPGSGIGLAVVATLMQRMGGTVRVEDATGGGADFQLSLSTMAAVASRMAGEQARAEAGAL